METLFQKHRKLISQVDTTIVRECMQQIAWNKPLVSIRGSRGVGKTTLMRQYIKQTYGVSAGEALYCAVDSIYFATHSLLDLAERFHLNGGKHLFLDEVHKYPSWSREIKEIADLYPDMRITFSGSSLLQILNADADLSRRVLCYNMAGLSFREFLQFYKGIAFPVRSLDEVLSNYDEICDEVNAVCRPQPLFEEYLRVGYYPFYDGNADEYYSRIENVVNFVVEQELTQFCGVDFAYTRKIKALIAYLAQNVPFQVNIAKLSSYLELNKHTVLNYLSSLHRGELISLIYSDTKSVTRMQKPDKIYLHNPNLFYALGQTIQVGTIRECFVANQLAVGHCVEYSPKSGDFRIDGRITFEVGGRDKPFDQIAQTPNSYVLADMLEYPVGRKLPIWLVGMLY